MAHSNILAIDCFIGKFCAAFNVIIVSYFSSTNSNQVIFDHQRCE